MSKAIDDVLAERQRQIEVEGWTVTHDDAHEAGELARASACYAFSAADQQMGEGPPTFEHDFMALWPWSRGWWKPKDPRRDLVRAAALLIAEIERMDRAQEEG